jgi:hypothetical protein
MLSEQRYRHLANRELFILRMRPDGFWKVAHFSLSSTNPARVGAIANPFFGKMECLFEPTVTGMAPVRIISDPQPASVRGSQAGH